jgi:hypothetical protein
MCMRTQIFSMTSAVLFLFACAGNRKSPQAIRAEDRQTIRTELAEESSLKADREQLAELRKNIPPEKQAENDELALQLTLMKQGAEQPNFVRERFNAMVRKKRASFRQKSQELRDDYRREELRRREEFMSGQRNKRESFMKRKPGAKEVHDFVSDQERTRQRFFADERDRRQNFESEMVAKSKDFDAYMRERQSEFNEQFRIYSKKFSERPKERKAVTGEEDEFDRLRDMQATPLGTED